MKDNNNLIAFIITTSILACASVFALYILNKIFGALGL